MYSNIDRYIMLFPSSDVNGNMNYVNGSTMIKFGEMDFRTQKRREKNLTIGNADGFRNIITIVYLH